MTNKANERDTVEMKVPDEWLEKLRDINSTQEMPAVEVALLTWQCIWDDDEPTMPDYRNAPIGKKP